MGRYTLANTFAAVLPQHLSTSIGLWLDTSWYPKKISMEQIHFDLEAEPNLKENLLVRHSWRSAAYPIQYEIEVRLGGKQIQTFHGVYKN